MLQNSDVWDGNTEPSLATGLVRLRQVVGPLLIRRHRAVQSLQFRLQLHHTRLHALPPCRFCCIPGRTVRVSNTLSTQTPRSRLPCVPCGQLIQALPLRPRGRTPCRKHAGRNRSSCATSRGRMCISSRAARSASGSAKGHRHAGANMPATTVHPTAVPAHACSIPGRVVRVTDSGGRWGRF